MTPTIRLPEPADKALVLACFWLPTAVVFLYCTWREGRRLGRERRALQTLAEAEAAEGYPPPDPPTTDSLPDARRPPT